MTKKPIIKIGNSNNYITRPDVIPGGENKDFFNGDDESFSQHKKDLILKTSIISEKINNNIENKHFSTIKVTLRDEALAKTHRPTKALFSDKYPVVGSGSIGELYVQVNAKSLPKLAARIAEAKVLSDHKFNDRGNLESKVGSLRSEVSAISDMSIYTNEDKSEYNDDAFIETLIDTKRDIIIELFNPKENQTLSATEIRSLKDNLINTLVTKISGFLHTEGSKYFSDEIITISPKDPTADDVKQLILLLKVNSLVKCYYFSPSIQFSDQYSSTDTLIKDFPQPLEGIDYPKVALIDSGVRSSKLAPWVKEGSDLLGDPELFDYHADEMASILIASKHLNNLACLEDDGCNIYDIWVPATSDNFDDHFSNLSEFTDWLYLEASAAREQGYRIFSMSLNFENISAKNEYSFLASRIDEMSKKLDILFIISIGNLAPLDYRPEWPANQDDVFKMLARHDAADKVLQPSDSISSISVGSINHIGNSLICDGAPTRYTRRGPAASFGIKPDVVHFGGVGDFNESGLRTLDGKNNIETKSHGTSLSAPHVAKIIAKVDQKSNGNLSTMCLKALLIHNSQTPKILNHKDMKKEARDFTGFGLPLSSEEIINKDVSSFTFVFEDSIKRGQVAEFNFEWPQSLVTSKGKCKGKSRITLLYEPPIDRDHGQEYIRANVDAVLQQEIIKGDDSSYVKKVKSIWDTKAGQESTYEKSLITHGFKWWPCKVYEHISKAGIGNTTNWRLRVKAQVRDGVVFPLDGIKFTTIITIEDPTEKSQEVYSDLLKSMTSIGVNIQDITIKSTVRV
jgi:hypothetical protein